MENLHLVQQGTNIYSVRNPRGLQVEFIFTKAYLTTLAWKILENPESYSLIDPELVTQWTSHEIYNDHFAFAWKFEFDRVDKSKNLSLEFDPVSKFPLDHKFKQEFWTALKQIDSPIYYQAAISACCSVGGWLRMKGKLIHLWTQKGICPFFQFQTADSFGIRHSSLPDTLQSQNQKYYVIRKDAAYMNPEEIFEGLTKRKFLTVALSLN